MPPIDLTRMSAHAINDRKNRFEVIENTIGWGQPIAMVPDREDPTATNTLTSTGVLVVRSNDNTIVTAWIANVQQASAIYHKATNGKRMPQLYWDIVNYNNNTEYWRNRVAA